MDQWLALLVTERGYGGERMDQWLALLVTERGAMTVNEWINGLHY